MLLPVPAAGTVSAVSDAHIVRVDPLDPAHDELFRGCIGVHDAAGREVYGELHTPWSVEEDRANHRVLADQARRVVAAAILDDAVVGACEVKLPLTDNTARAEITLAVLPEYRRRGIGSMLLRHVERIAADNGRTILGADSEVAEGREDPAEGFAAEHGYTAEQTEIRSDLLLPADERALATADAEVAAYSAGYTVLTSWDGIPDEWLADRAELSRRMSTDAPLGGLEYHEEHWDAARVIRSYELLRAQRRRIVESFARQDASGRLVAFSQIVLPAHTPTLGYQDETLVLGEHRGHRLGLLVKLANLRTLRARLPDLARIVTWNAAENAPMLRVNRLLGFQPVGRATAWQKKLI